MSTLTAHELLQTWERARGEHPLRRSLALLHRAWPEVNAQQWAEMPIGARDGCLFTLYETLFGSDLDTLAACPACSEPLQLNLSAADLRPARAGEVSAAAPSALHCDGYELGYRLPNSDDLLDLIDACQEMPEAAVARLLERCVFYARHGDEPAALGDLPANVIDRLQQEMALRDPGVDTAVALVCPACGQTFERCFDIGAYLWDELDDWAERTLAEVHTLASAYGWSEPQVLALSAARRRHYIGLVQG